MRRYLPLIIVVVVAIAVATGGTFLYRAKKPVALRGNSARSTNAHVRGNATAPVTIEEYGDYQCPPCGKLAEPLKEIERDYGDRVRLVFHHFPLIVHNHAREAAFAAEAAAQQGKFWEMHDMIFREQAVWTKATDVATVFSAYAGVIGLDVERFKRDMQSDAVKARVDSDQREGTNIGVQSTPTLFVNNHAVMVVNGDLVKPLRDAIEEALKPQKTAKDRQS